jgi:hypothetical protein
MTTPLTLQHVIVKIPIEGDLGIEPGDLIPVFHRWVAAQSMPELLIDVADLRHVPSGPGVVLVGSEADYSLDHTDGTWGLQYRRKDALDGSNLTRLTQALEAARRLGDRLEEELEGRLRYSRSIIDVIVNDRALAPNTEETRRLAAPDLEQFAQAAFGSPVVTITPHAGDSRRRFGVRITTVPAGKPS